MTVKELIELLHQYPDDTMVLVDGYEDGVTELDIKNVRFAPLDLNVYEEWYYGEHKIAESKDTCDAFGLILQRS